MADPFIAEIKMVPYNFAPRGWAFCDGQLLPISQNTALFSLVGTTYGGDGRTTFGLPNLQGRLPRHPGQGPGLSSHFLGEIGGTATATLSIGEMPSHNHLLTANTNPADLSAPSASRALARSSGGFAWQDTNANLVDLAPQGVANAGGGQAHNNMMPYLTLNFCIALVGIYPSRA
jgi:microcystin-dependent protein